MRATELVDVTVVMRGSRAFRAKESRDAMYKVATFWIEHFWGKPRQMADGLGVLLLTWNNALYRYGPFDFRALESVLRKNLSCLGGYRARDISTLTPADKEPIRSLFDSFLNALQIADGKSKGVRSPVAVAKALHLLAPAFFPLWDDKIARAYGCHYATQPSLNYFVFSEQAKRMADAIKHSCRTRRVTLLKVIDEYNYARFTKNWI